MGFAIPQVFATIDIAPTINLITVNPASIDVYCTNPLVSGGTTITGNVLEIYDVTYDGLGVDIDVSKSNLICDGLTLNKINTISLVDLSNYSVRLTMSTDDSGNTFFDDDSQDFTQPKSNGAILFFSDLTTEGPITIQFRDVSITDVDDPLISIPPLTQYIPGSFSVTDHNANFDLGAKQKIIVKINGVDTQIEETGLNTGIFQSAIIGGDTVFYDPGTLGFARSTITIDFDIDPENGLSLVNFAADEKHDNLDSDGLFTFSETVYRDVDLSDSVTAGDIRLANAATYGFIDGSTVSSFDADEFFPLVSFASDEKHSDSGISSGFETSETIYRDTDSSSSVTLNDIRLGNIKISGYFDGSTVSSDAFDGKGDIIIEDIPLDDSQIGLCTLGFSPSSHAFSVTFTHGGSALSDIDVVLSYADLVSLDPALLQMYYQGQGLGYGLVTASADTASHNSLGKTVTSNPDFPISLGQLYNNNLNGDGTGQPLPMTHGSYALGFDNGCGGGGGGGISRSGLVVQAVGAIALFGGGAGESGPPSFGDSDFTLMQDDSVISPGSILGSSLEVGKKSTISFGFKMPGGLNDLDHVGLYANLGKGETKNKSDTFIYFDKFKTPQVTIEDPQGFFKSVNVDVTEPSKRNITVNYTIEFAKPLPNSNVVFEAWNLKRDSAIKEISGLLQVKEDTKPEVIIEATPAPVAEKTGIPEWIKSNAGWWGQGQINDETFTNGIGFLIQNRIIDSPALITTNESPDPTIDEPIEEFVPVIPDWVKNNALWWSEDKLTDADFVAGLKYLLDKGIIQVRV